MKNANALRRRDLLPDDAVRAPRSDRIPMVGNRYGNLVVLAEAGWKRYENPRCKPHRLVLVRCDCGAEYVTEAAPIRAGSTKRCRDCRVEHLAEYQRDGVSVLLPDGRTIAQIAEASGLRLDTVYHRYIRGWPHHRLGEVPGHGPHDRRVRS